MPVAAGLRRDRPLRGGVFMNLLFNLLAGRQTLRSREQPLERDFGHGICSRSHSGPSPDDGPSATTRSWKFHAAPAAGAGDDYLFGVAGAR